MSDPTPTRRSPTRGAQQRRRVLRGLAGLAATLAIWWLVTAVVVAPSDMMSRFGPADAIGALSGLLVDGAGVEHAVVTLRRLLIGLALAAVVGVPVGLAVGLSPRLAETTGATFQFVRMISPLAWTPVAIVIFGVGDAPVYFLVAIAAVWPLVLNTAAGVHALDHGWLLVARSLGATPFELLRTIVLPGVRGHVVTGLRVALGIAWVVIVPAEMLGVDSGLGFAILDARDRLRYDELMGIIVLIGVIGFVLDGLAQRLTGAVRGRRRRTIPRPLTDAPPEPTPATADDGGAR